MNQEEQWLLPDGVEEVLPERARAIEQLRRRALDLYQSWGYELVYPPLIEFLESLLNGAGRDLERDTFKITDQLSGRLMGVRADMTPQVARIDLIIGDVTGPAADREAAANPTTRVARRFTAEDWRRNGEDIIVTHTLSGLTGDAYIRVRGTGGTELEPSPDPAGEDPWSDLWFYANPVFLEMATAK